MIDKFLAKVRNFFLNLASYFPETDYICININLKHLISRRIMYLLGYDIGSSSVKASLVNAVTGKCVASAFFPKTEAKIMAVQPGWAEQDPQNWWENLKLATQAVMAESGAKADEVDAIGISYQMHGLVCVDKDQQVLRPAIIWCDSRAVPYGQKAFETLGQDTCLSHLLNSPGNFTASKLAWVKENEPEIFEKIDKIMLPGDYIAMKLSGTVCTTVSGLSEGMFWDFQKNEVAGFLMDYYGFDRSLIPEIKPTFSEQGRVNAWAAQDLGLKEGTPITYRGVTSRTMPSRSTCSIRAKSLRQPVHRAWCTG
jgi:xylulokinase